MRTLTIEEIKEALEKHTLWLEDNNQGICANFSCIDFTKTYLNFSGLDLRESNFSCANLKGYDFNGANLWNADLRYAILEGVNFEGANLQRINLQGANLHNANLSEAELFGANLYNANLQDVNFQNAELFSVNLRNANLKGANLQGANLHYADIDNSCLPLHFGGLNWEIDERIAMQLIYHVCSMKCNSKKFIALRNTMLDFANEFQYACMDVDYPELKPIEYSPPTQ
jgi:hypothetical protein